MRFWFENNIRIDEPAHKPNEHGCEFSSTNEGEAIDKYSPIGKPVFMAVLFMFNRHLLIITL